ncbi:MAG TPA: PASTA domain-containing protein [Candidatus Wallbacteria bacterium]|nr:PASTA domain-containing protein [Candidatus Wallbacteria bacterium]
MRFTQSRAVKGNILIALLKFLIFIIFFVILFQFAKMYSIKMMNSFFNKEETKVPNLVSQDGMPVRIEDAFELCKQCKLQLDIKDKKHDNNIPEGCIITQDPPPDTIVKANRVMEVILSLGAKTIDCPDITGKDLRDVAFIIQKEGFLIGKKSYIFSESVAVDTVISQTPEGGKPAPKGAQIDLLVSQGKANSTVKMPNFIGRRIEAVKIVLSKINLDLGKIGYEKKEGTASGIVLAQEPAAGSGVADKTPVNFIVCENSDAAKPEENKDAVIIKTDGVKMESSESNVIKIDAGSKEAPLPLIETRGEKTAEAPAAAAKPLVEAGSGDAVKKVEIIKFIVPPGQKSREVKMVLLDDMGPREIYKNPHYPGEEIDLSVNGYGAMKVLVYLDNVFFKDIEVGVKR